MGDRVIARRNDRDADVDNGTRGTVRGVDLDPLAVTIQTDDGELRELPADYVAEHLELAYALTGHASQGATVERAQVIGTPEAFTNEWAYTALSRARDPVTVHLIAEPTDRSERAEFAPADRDGPRGRRSRRCARRCAAANARTSRSTKPPSTSTAHPSLGRPPPTAQNGRNANSSRSTSTRAVGRRAGARDASGRARPRAAVASGANASSRPHRPRRDRTRAAGPRPRPARTAR